MSLERFRGVGRPKPVSVASTLDGAGDGGFDEFYASHVDRAARLAHLVTGSAAVGLDIAQDAMVAVHRRWANLRTPEAFLRSAVLNLCRSRQRRWIRERRWIATSRPSESIGIPELDELWTLIAELPARQREVVVLRFYEDLTIDQIASVLAIPAGTVKSTLHRALDALRGVLGDDRRK